MIDQQDWNQPELLPCPFCGKEPTLTKHYKEDVWGLTHRCEVIGPFSFSWGSREMHTERWNRRALPAVQAGWKLVPVEPTDEMIEAAASFGGLGGYSSLRGTKARETWADMLSAAPDFK